jgi:pimeloyl-ACP methyl ester carboxylesterase
MNQKPNVLWLSISPSLKCFDQRLLSKLVKFAAIQRWEYCQTLDEPCCIDDVVAALHEFLARRDYKTHLLGHGVSGIVALLYARRYPERVASLTLLSVGALPAVNWQAHYYALRKLLPCSREIILAQMTRLLFGPQPARFAQALSHLLARDLDSNLTLHSLAHHTAIPAGATEVPLLVCNGEEDPITFTQKVSLWHDWMKPGDRLWTCAKGQHFFHFYHFQAVADVIAEHWQQLPSTSWVVPPASSLVAPFQNEQMLTRWS